MKPNFAIFMLFILFLNACSPALTPSPVSTSALIELPSSTPLPATKMVLPSASPTATLIPTATLPPVDAFMKGLVYYPAGWAEGDQRPETDWILKNIALPTGANWIRLHIPCYQDNTSDTKIYCTPNETMTGDAYLHLVKTAHSLGLRVMSEHYLITRDPEGYWAGDIGKKYNESQWA